MAAFCFGGAEKHDLLPRPPGPEIRSQRRPYPASIHPGNNQAHFCWAKGPALVENSSRYLASRGCYHTPGCRKAGERAGSTCAIDVEGFKRRRPSKVGGLCHGSRA